MGSPASWTDVEKTIVSGIVGDSTKWPQKIHDALQEKDLLQYTTEYPDAEKVKELIKYAISDFNELLMRRIVGLTMVMSISQDLYLKGLIKKV